MHFMQINEKQKLPAKQHAQQTKWNTISQFINLFIFYPRDVFVSSFSNAVKCVYIIAFLLFIFTEHRALHIYCMKWHEVYAQTQLQTFIKVKSKSNAKWTKLKKINIMRANVIKKTVALTPIDALNIFFRFACNHK